MKPSGEWRLSPAYDLNFAVDLAALATPTGISLR
ncbi:MAG: HipA domain-containing protein [Dysgonamonadaceae bacterium]|nr:HipA domain-containing protein [Dysgonamonadaceae bacterium]